MSVRAIMALSVSIYLMARLPVLRCPPVHLMAPIPPSSSPFPYRKLAGSFVEAAANDGDSWDGSGAGSSSSGGSDSWSQGSDYGTQDGSDLRLPADWSSRAQTARACWARPEYRDAVLAKRSATMAAKKSKLPPKQPRPPLSEAVQKRSDAMRLLRTDEEAWLKKRLAAGAERRAALNNDEVKRQKQLERSEAAKKRHAARKAKVASAGPSSEPTAGKRRPKGATRSKSKSRDPAGEQNASGSDEGRTRTAQPSSSTST